MENYKNFDCDLILSYKTQNLCTTQIGFQKSDLHKDEVAVVTQLILGLETEEAPKKIKMFEEEALDDVDIDQSME